MYYIGNRTESARIVTATEISREFAKFRLFSASNMITMTYLAISRNLSNDEILDLYY